MDKRQDYNWDDLPNCIEQFGDKFYYQTRYRDAWFKSRNFTTPGDHDYRLFYICYRTGDIFCSVRGDGRQECIDKMKDHLFHNKSKYAIIHKNSIPSPLTRSK